MVALILNLDTRITRVVNLTFGTLYPEESTQVHI